MIDRVKGGWAVRSRRGRRLAKKPKSKQAAIRQLYAVEMSKARRAGASAKSARRLASAAIKESV